MSPAPHQPGTSSSTSARTSCISDARSGSNAGQGRPDAATGGVWCQLDSAEAHAGPQPVSKPIRSLCVSNQPHRVEQLIAEFGQVIKDGVLQFACARRLRGRLLFARSVCYGCFGAVALKAVNGAIAEAGESASDAKLAMEAELCAALANLKEAIVGKPTHAIPVKPIRPIHIFTDGACEPGPDGRKEEAIGGVLIGIVGKKYL